MKYNNLPNLKDARYRNVNYKAPILRDPIQLNEQQKCLGLGKFFNVLTYGCQANVRDSEVITGILTAMGYCYCDDLAKCDVIIMNTCAIRENAENKVFGQIGFFESYKRLNKDLIIGVCGCMAQEEEIVNRILTKYPIVELIFGTHNIPQLPELLENIVINKEKSICVLSQQGVIYEGLPSVRQLKHKTFVNIMDGCDKFCTYCIVPYTRGQQRSRLMEDVLAECQCLYNEGYKEITLIGQNVNAYGKDLDTDYNFAQLLAKVSDIGIPRVRFTTSHPWDFTDEMIDVIATRDNIMPFIHLPLQSGNDEILKLMGRRYTSKDYIELFDKIVAKVKDVAISTDIIVGFPNETQEQFEDTLKIVEYCKYDNAYSFVYSPRCGTPAAKMADSIDLATKKARLQVLNERLGYYSKLNNKKYEGKIVEVLVDGVSKTDSNILSGYTPQNKLVNFRSSKAKIGDLINVKITEGMKNSLNGIDVEDLED